MRFSLAKLLLAASAVCGYLGFVVASNPLVGLLGLSILTLLLPGLYAGLWIASSRFFRPFLFGCVVSTAPFAMMATWGLYFCVYEIGPELNWTSTDSDIATAKAFLVIGHLIILLGGLISYLLSIRSKISRHRSA